MESTVLTEKKSYVINNKTNKVSIKFRIFNFIKDKLIKYIKSTFGKSFSLSKLITHILTTRSFDEIKNMIDAGFKLYKLITMKLRTSGKKINKLVTVFEVRIKYDVIKPIMDKYNLYIAIPAILCYLSIIEYKLVTLNDIDN